MSSHPPLYPSRFYHIYNRGNNRENIFIEERNYSYFLTLYDRHIYPIVNTYAYCLLGNHFHFLVRIREPADYLKTTEPIKSPSQKFSNFFNAYARTINLTYGRTGALFQRPFGRQMIHSKKHLIHLVKYIHQNPQKHGFVEDYRDWPYSLYGAMIDDQPTYLNRDVVLSWFGGLNGFLESHQAFVFENTITYLIADDD